MKKLRDLVHTHWLKYLKFILISNLVLFKMSIAITADNTSLQSYNQRLVRPNNHQFNDNQIRSFVYYWFGLHDKHAPIEQSLELLDTNNLNMIYPEITVKNVADYKKWYDGVGTNIKSNIHTIKELQITYLPNHKYKLNIVVNWQAINKDNKFINVNATQEWILVDGKSTWHPYVQEYKVLKFTTID